MSDPLPPGALNGVEVVSSDTNASCEATCEAKGKRCSAKHLAYLNSCDRLREHYGCEAGCELVEGLGPGYVSSGAPKTSRPAICFAQPPASSRLSCSAAEAQHHMLCPCV
jgi:hypothetical protein